MEFENQPIAVLPEVYQPQVEQNIAVAENNRGLGKRALEAVKNNKFKLAAGAMLATVALGVNSGKSEAFSFPPMAFCNPDPAVVCDMGIQDSQLTNFETRICQSEVQELKFKNSYYSGLIKSRDISYKLDSKKVVVKEDIRGNEQWEGNRFLFSCAKVIDTTLTQKFVRKVKNKKTQKVGYKSLSKSRTIKVNTNEDFIPSHASTRGDFTLKRKVTLPVKITKNQVKKRAICLKETVATIPKIQVPYIDELNLQTPEASAPGPIFSTSQTKYTCMDKTQVKNYKTSKHKK